MAYTNNNGQIRVGVRPAQTITSSLLQSIYGVWNAETTTTTLATGAYGAWNGEGILSGTQLSASMSNAWQGNNSAFSSTNYSTITASMSNLWKAENNTTDSIGGLVGTSPSGSAPTFTTGKLGTSAFLFDGVNDFIKLPVGSLQFTGDFTISLWFKPSTLRNGDILLSNYSLRSSDYNRFGWEIRLGNGSKYQFTQANNSVYNATLEASIGPVAGVWQLLTIVRTAATSKMYVNGSLVGQVANTISLAYNANSVPTIGAETYITWSDNTTSTNSYFNGAIDEIGMWTRGLSNNEVIGLYEAGNGQTYPYSNSTTVLSDSYGTNHGIMRGVTYSTGKIGNALLFNGSSYVDLPVGALDKTSDFSVSLWIYPTVNNTMTLISSHDGQKGWQIQYLSGNLWFWGSNGSLGATQTIQVQTGHSIVLNTWTHLLVTVKNSVQVKTYINGVLTNTISTTGKPITYNYYSPYYLPLIGAKRYFNGMSGNADNSEFFTGKLDGIGLWDRELTSSEASAIYNGGSGNEYPFSNASVSSPADSVSTNHGTIVGGVTYTTGVIGNAFTFNGSNYISLPTNSLSSLTGDFSISCWVNLTSLTSVQCFLSNYIFTSGINDGYIGFRLYYNTTGGVRFEIGDINSVGTILSTNNYLTTNAWYNIVVTRKGSTRTKIYINGLQSVSNTDSRNPAYVTTYPAIGTAQYLSNNTTWFMSNGTKIDAVNVWNKELTDDEVTQLYNMGGGIQYPFTTQTIKAPYAVYNGENLNDSVGTNNLTVGAGTVTYTTGKVGNAFTLAAGQLNFPTNSMQFSNSFSYAFWIKYTGTSPLYNGLFTAGGNQSKFGYSMYNYSGSLYTRFGDGTTVNNDMRVVLNPSFSFVADTWYHIAVVFNAGSSAQVYANGQLLQSVNHTMAAVTYDTTRPNPIFGNNPGAGAYGTMTGQVDGLTFWNSALTAPEVFTLFNDGNGMEYPYSSTLPAKLPSFTDSVSTNHGTSPATSAPTFTTGKFGKAFSFDGVNDHILLPSTALKFTEDFSVSLWVYIPISNSSPQALISCRRIPSISTGWEMRVGSNTIYFGFGAANGFKSTSYSNNSNIGSWKHVVATRKNGTGGKLYIDGILQGTISAVEPISYDSVDTPSIGAMKYAPNTTWYVQNGTKMDAISTWTKELTATEITDLYNLGNGKQYPNY